MSPNTPLMRSHALPQTWLIQAALVVAGTMFIALAAQISVPFYPVPVTLQTLAILIVGFTYGSRLGALTLIAYLAEGAMGMPVFAAAMNGAAFAGPTAGFLVGFVGMAWLAGFAVEKGLARGIVTTAIAATAISALLYLPGLAWPAAIAQTFGFEGGWVAPSVQNLWAWFVGPFVIGDLAKAIIAALVVTGARFAFTRKA